MRVCGIRHGTMGLLRRPLQFEEQDLSIANGDILRLGGTILGTTNKGDPFAFPMPDGTISDLSASVIEGVRQQQSGGAATYGGIGHILGRSIAERTAFMSQRGVASTRSSCAVISGFALSTSISA